jgi:antitoxin component YwqK of YwqJK toxin-antitoxin module
VFDARVGGWVHWPLDEQGQRHGRFTARREDGSTLLEGEFSHGQPVGTFVGYHPSGEVASQAPYRDGKLDGRLVRFASDAKDAVPLRGCCVPTGARQMLLFYDSGRVRAERFLDGQGRALRSDGSLLPELPQGLPEWADFDESTQLWLVRGPTEEGRATLSYFDQRGGRVEEVDLAGGRRVGSRTFAPDGEPRAIRHFDDKGKLHGEYSCRHDRGSPYRDGRIAREQGAFEHGQPVGRWRFFDAQGIELADVDRGLVLDTDALAELSSAPLADEDLAVTAERARSLARASKVRQGLLWAARVLGRSGTDRSFQALLDAVVVPLGEAQLAAWQRALEKPSGVDLHTALAALVSGANPVEALRVAATLLPEGNAASLDLIEAARVLEPGNPRVLASRALLQLEHGRVEPALSSAQELRSSGQPETADHLELSARVLYGPYSFTPAQEPLPVSDEELPEVTVDQPLEHIHRAIATYATRLGELERQLQARLGHRPLWLRVDTKSLLPDGPVPLRQARVTIEDPTEEGVETSEVEVDETAGLAGRSVRALATTARADWDALCWLCWASGLDRVALPEVVEPPARLAAVVNEAMVRAFLLQDQLRTGGLAARVRKLSSFDWEGVPIGALPRSLVGVLARQYLERRAVLFWLMFAQNFSPFQADLRRV